MDRILPSEGRDAGSIPAKGSMKCVFCDISELEKRTVIDDGLSFVFPTNIPIVPGHVLIAPKRCVQTYADLTPKEKQSIESLRVRIVSALTLTFGATGFNFAWNEGKEAGQSVPHFHLHILPRKSGDSGITEYEPRKFLYRSGSRAETPESELEEVAAAIRKHLRV